MSGTIARLCFFALVLLGATSSRAAPDLPDVSPDNHLGVGTCSGAPCHGNAAAVGNKVLQNEHTTWIRQDAHSGAYEVLLGDRAKRIARNLRLPTPAHEAALCLDCHADNVPPERRGAKFALEDGVGCEACHGGSQRWLGAHISGSGSHPDYVELGLYPTDDPVARAELCVSCHYGNGRKFVRHRIMGAGHPRLSFELDTFTHQQPAHFQVDDDYTDRGKRVASSLQTWAIGQAVIVRQTLDTFLDPKRARDGIWPEFVLFDCHACHHPMSEPRWRPRSTTGLGDRPGTARFNDASFLMLVHALRPVDPAASDALRAGSLRLHSAVSRGSGKVADRAAELRQLVVAAIPKLSAWQPDADDVRQIAESLLEEGRSGEYRDYVAAEQATMAVQSLAATLHALGQLGRGDYDRINAQIEQLLARTEDDDGFRPDSVPPLLDQLRPMLR